MATKRQLENECKRRNRDRCVTTNGKRTCGQFCKSLGTSVLISGNANWKRVKTNLVKEYVDRADMPTIILTVHSEWDEILEQTTAEGAIRGFMSSGPNDRSFHALLGLRQTQILYLIDKTADEFRMDRKDEMLTYAEGFLAILQKMYPLSLPAMIQLAKESDDRICRIGRSKQVPVTFLDKISGNWQGGIIFRRLLTRMQDIFEWVTDENCASNYCFLSGVPAGVPFMVFHQHSSSQTVMNGFLKEELENIRKRYGRFRVILDDAAFTNAQDELLQYLMRQMRLRNLEVIVCSNNAPEMLMGESYLKLFESMAVFPHDSETTTEQITKTFGPYRHHEVMMGAAGFAWNPIAAKKNANYTMHAEERLKVRGNDLKASCNLLFRKGDQVALKLGTASKTVELVPIAAFYSEREHGLKIADRWKRDKEEKRKVGGNTYDQICSKS